MHLFSRTHRDKPCIVQRLQQLLASICKRGEALTAGRILSRA
jgi:hypothetical protein